MALDVSREDFEVLVGEELDTLPDDVVDGLVNVAILIQDRPDDGSLDLLGLYDGISLTRRSHYGFGELPDRILLFREPLLMVCATFEELREQVHVTLVHEIAHFYGIDDAKLDELGWG
jgi:predicted Zn-dependent protease with MMP-like domain